MVVAVTPASWTSATPSWSTGLPLTVTLALPCSSNLASEETISVAPDTLHAISSPGLPPDNTPWTSSLFTIWALSSSNFNVEL